MLLNTVRSRYNDRILIANFYRYITTITLLNYLDNLAIKRTLRVERIYYKLTLY